MRNQGSGHAPADDGDRCIVLTREHRISRCVSRGVGKPEWSPRAQLSLWRAQ
jgi:hypothetical protein